MAHAISIINGAASMAYVGETPWHGLGQRLTVGAPLEAWQVEAGLNYNVCRSRVRFGATESPQVWDARHVLFRSDTKAPLAVVSEDYQIVQPAEVLEFFRNLCEDHGFALETAGSLYQGARYWALARTPETFTLPGNDTISQYVLMATSCDGSLATTGQLTNVRVVCNNTLRASLDSGAKAVKVRHSSVFHATKMQIDLGLAHDTFGQFAAAASAMATRKISKKEAVSILIRAMGDDSKPVEEQPNARAMGEIINLFDGKAIGSNLASADGTLWGLVNATTEYFDHHAGRSQDSRLASAWFGQFGERKDKVFAEARVALAA